MSNHFKSALARWSVVVSIAIVGLVALLVGIQLTVHAQAQQIGLNISLPTPQASSLFRFDSSAQTLFTLTLAAGSMPQSVVVSGTAPTHVWVTEPDRNQIVQLVYTNTTDFVPVEYPVTSTQDSRPYRLTIDNNYVWFTERGADRIGRLNALTHQIDEFYDHGLSSNAGLADIKIAPDGRVWATAQWSNRLVQLTITSTVDYAFSEYTDPLLISPFGLAIESNDAIWVASSGGHEIGRFMPSFNNSFFWSHLLPSDSAPTELTYSFIDTGKPHSEVWFSDRARNGLGLLFLSTLPTVSYFNPITQATGLARESQNVFWLTQQDQQGSVARVIITDALSSQIDSYLLPTLGMVPTSIAVAPDHGVWLTAYVPNRVYLPTILRN